MVGPIITKKENRLPSYLKTKRASHLLIPTSKYIIPPRKTIFTLRAVIPCHQSAKSSQIPCFSLHQTLISPPIELGFSMESETTEKKKNKGGQISKYEPTTTHGYA